ncbi:13289_t:CDS:2 [Gigaspora rosea]|nr:13289_t:CDS:2 [Gigaspora rosea]
MNVLAAVQEVLMQRIKTKSNKSKSSNDPPINNNNINEINNSNDNTYEINNSDDNIHEINNSKSDKSKASNEPTILIENNILNAIRETGLSCPIDNIGLCDFDAIDTTDATQTFDTLSVP